MRSNQSSCGKAWECTLASVQTAAAPALAIAMANEWPINLAVFSHDDGFVVGTIMDMKRVNSVESLGHLSRQVVAGASLWLDFSFSFPLYQPLQTYGCMVWCRHFLSFDPSKKTA
jgi:hypothetical protein